MKFLAIVCTIFILHNRVKCYPDPSQIILINHPEENGYPSIETYELEPPIPKFISEIVYENQYENLEKTSADSIPEGISDDSVSITGPVSQVISPSVPHNSHVVSTNTVTSHVPPQGPSTIPYSSTGGLLSNLPLVGGNRPITSTITSGLLGQGGNKVPILLPLIQQLLLGILGGGLKPIHRPTGSHAQVSPANVVIPGYSITVGGGGITLPGVSRH